MKFLQHMIQLHALMTKIFLQKLRSPVITAFEILLPPFFALMLLICYRQSSTKIIVRNTYADTPFANTTEDLDSIFCLHPASSLELDLPPCLRSEKPLYCSSLIANGTDVCISHGAIDLFEAYMEYLVNIDGPLTVPSLDSYLIQSAFVTERSYYDRPILFQLSSVNSFAHYGSLLVSSDDAALALEFMQFCRVNSVLCNEILHTDRFTSLKSAQDYAVAHSNTVWAIVHLPKHSTQPGPGKSEFTLSLNSTATPNKVVVTKSVRFGEQVRDYYYPDVYYWASGFSTLQAFVQEFYLQRNLAGGVESPYGVQYACTAQTRGTSCFLNRYGLNHLPFPTPEMRVNDFINRWVHYIPMIMILVVLFLVSNFTAMVVEEKARGTAEAMLIMGMPARFILLGWYLYSLILNAVVALLTALCMKFGFLAETNYGILLFLYFTLLNQSCSLCLLLSTIFANPSIASWCACLLIFFLTITAYVVPLTASDSTLYALSLLPCTGPALAFFRMLKYAVHQQHFSWKEAGESGVNKMTGVMWASAIFMMLLAVYLNRVLPTMTGSREHPLFFLNFIFRRFGRRRQTAAVPVNPNLYLSPLSGSQVELDARGADVVTAPQRKAAQQGFFETPDELVDPSDPDTFVAFQNVRKVYYSSGLWALLRRCFSASYRASDRKVVLDGVSFAMKRGEVTALLGPNGVGKSTLMKLATGQLRPTGGKVFIRGYRTTRDNDKCRQHIGYCSQSDILWFSLTVEDHLTFYARLKLGKVRVQAYVDKAVRMVELEEKRHAQAKTLSTGQRRRLCFAIALVADSDVLFLDEPTAGMDFETRDFVHKAIQRARHHSSVLVSTHILDEADHIADRVVVMNRGKLSAEGKPMFLKSCLTNCYTLTCEFEKGLSHEARERAHSALVEFIGNHNNSLSVSSSSYLPASNTHADAANSVQVTRNGNEVWITLSQNYLFSKGEELVRELETHKHAFKIRDIVLNSPTMRDVFLYLAKNHFNEVRDLLHNPTLSLANEGLVEMECKYASSKHFSIFRRHFRALFRKRLSFAKRDLKMIIIQIVLPLLFVVLSLLVDLISEPTVKSFLLDMTMFHGHTGSPAEVPFALRNDGTSNAFQLSANVSDSAFGEHYKALFVQVPAPFSVAAFVEQKLMDEYFNHPDLRLFGLAPQMTEADGSPAAALYMFNTTYEHAAPQAINALYNLATERLFGSQVPQIVARNAPMPLGKIQKDLIDSFKQILSCVFVTVPYLIIPVSIISHIVREKETGAEHIQSLSGANMIAFHLSALCFDTICYGVTLVLTLIGLWIFGRDEFVGSDVLGPTILTFVLYGLSSIALVYLIAPLFKTSRVAQMVVLLLNFVGGFLWSSVELMAARYSLTSVKVFSHILRVLPAAAFSESMMVISSRALTRLMLPPDSQTSIFDWYDLTWEGITSGGIGSGLVYMAVVTLLCVGAFLVLEFTQIRTYHLQVFRLGSKKSPPAPSPSDPDSPLYPPDRAHEPHSNQAIEPGEYNIVLENLTKRFRGMPRNSLEKVSFGVHKGEVLCLLGPNGAGKTTTLKILSGEDTAFSGAAYINGIPIRNRVIRGQIGYCPQYNPLLDNLSPVEHLWLYARLRNIREDQIEDEVNVLLKELGLEPFRDTMACALSGGNQRRLSLAIALVGRTNSVLLDEPTASMDIVGRLQTQAMLRRVVRQRSIIFATHLVDDIEALSDRVVVLVKGNIHCIGALGEIRKRDGESEDYTVHIAFPPEVNLLEEHQAAIQKLQQRCRSPTETMEANPLSRTTVPVHLVIEKVQPTSLVVTLRGDLCHIIQLLSHLHKARLQGVPAVKCISISKKPLQNFIPMK